MPNQSATNVLVAIKRETTFGTPATPVTGADRLRALDSPGLKKTRGNIESAERRSDQLQNIGRLGGITVGGSFNCEINPGGDFDSLLEDLVRGTQGALAEETEIDAGGIGVGTRQARIFTPVIPIFRSYTIDQYDIDIDQSEQFVGCRVVQGDFSFQPNEMATVQWTFQGQDRNELAIAASPYFTSPILTAGIPLIADDAVITYKGAVVTKLTGMNLSVVTDAAGQPTIGSFLTPDIFMNMLRVSGDVTAVREDLLAATDFDAETEFEMKIVMQAPTAAPKLTFGVILRRVKLVDVDAPYSGGDAAKLETRQFMAHAPSAASNAVEFYTSTETPTLV